MENVAKVAELLIKSVDAEIEASDLLDAKVSTKDAGKALEAAGVPSHKVSSFLTVFRAFKQGLHLGFSKEQMRKLAPSIAKLIGKGLADNKPVGKDTYMQALLGKKADEVLATFDPVKARENAEKKESAKAEKEAAKALEAMPAKERAKLLLQEAIKACIAAGVNPAEVIASMQRKPTEIKKAA